MQFSILSQLPLFIQAIEIVLQWNPICSIKFNNAKSRGLSNYWPIICRSIQNLP